ncbi:MAG: glycosyltransferase family 2 protein [Deltaproteobacteria bacterium]|nr:glycosyltransferase family 2 protein [Deltaproteobacteria bacterium]
MKICAIIPVYNNAETVSDIVHRCRAVIEPDILVVADGPTDGSEAQASDAGADVISLPENMGKGRAITVGLVEAKERGYTHAIVLDADGQHLPEEIPKLYDAIGDFPERLLIGVREMDPDKTPKSSRRGRSISNFWTTLNGWQRCRDAQCGFRVYPIEQVLALGCKEPGFQFEMEVLIRASWAGIRFNHMDIDVVYPINGRVSHFDKKRDNLRFSWLSFKMFWGMLARLPVLTYRKISGV